MPGRSRHGSSVIREPLWFAKGILLIFSVLTISCAQEKTVQKVFSDSNPQQKSQCSGSAIPTEFIVNWKMGTSLLKKLRIKMFLLKNFWSLSCQQSKRSNLIGFINFTHRT
jgi:hypothetical protein